MTSKEIRQAFFDYFEDQDHKIVPSAPIVLKDDPTLMFTNAGMNQFKDYFLGDKTPKYRRVADTQKCLRVSGKHNDLEEVGRDSYHHTMFEMLGNWSFGDYFKREAIDFAWELLTEVYNLDKDRLYVTVFEGDKVDNLNPDNEARELWKQYVPESRILWGSKEDNFWEMGDVGPCGPCSEIHIDLRSESERKRIGGDTLVNQDDPLVVELWNLVFIQYNRKADGSLESLKENHVDTGMGFERLAMAIQSKKSNYDTDVFRPFISFLETESGIDYTKKYGEGAETDIAMRVIADHIRAVGFAIADGAMPSNTGAGYVIRRILRRAVRFYYSFLDIDQPLMYRMVPILSQYFGDVFPEISAQVEFITKVIREEEATFLNTLSEGLKRIENLELKEGGVLSGETAFMLYDTYGFPLDLTQLIADENRCEVDVPEFREFMKRQKERSRKAGDRTEGDWVVINDELESSFIGYDNSEASDIKIIKYRTIEEKGKKYYQVVLDKTPFYPEGGGQIGDIGFLSDGDNKYSVLDTIKENDLIIHQLKQLPDNLESTHFANINEKRRRNIENNHSATHLLHAALRKILGDHVQQKGSLVSDKYLRFDFSHFEAVTDDNLKKIEHLVNQKIRENISLVEDRELPLEEAKERGAMMLFGEKYGEQVRMITFDHGYSMELCGGCHVDNTGRIGLFKIISESSVAAGVRRIEAITADAAEDFINDELATLESVRSIFKNPVDIVSQINSLLEGKKALEKELSAFQGQATQDIKGNLLKKEVQRDGYSLIADKVSLDDGKQLKDLTFQLLDQSQSMVIVIGADIQGKAQLTVACDKSLVESLGIDAGKLIKSASRHIRGGGGGQAFYATAGGADPEGITAAINEIIDQLP